MRLNLLHLDDALLRQPRFVAAAKASGAREISLTDLGPSIRLWVKPADLENLRGRLAAALQGLDHDEPVVTWMGSGDFHHVSALLVSLIGEARNIPLTVIQFDNHPDWVSCRRGIHCGSWIRYILDNRLAQRVVSIGSTSTDLAWPEFKGAGLGHVAASRLVLFPGARMHSMVLGDYGYGQGHDQKGRRITWRGNSSVFSERSAARVLQAIETEAIYITIDKDVLAASDADTNWDQGQMRRGDLTAWLKVLASHHKVLGLDVLGDRSVSEFEGPLMSRFLKRSEILIDQPWRCGQGQSGNEINEKTNLALLDAVGALLC